MAMVHRGNKRYYYRSVRVGNRVTRLYQGKQEQADLAEAQHKKEREERAAEKAEARYNKLLLKAAIALYIDEQRRQGWRNSGGEMRRMSRKIVRRQPKPIRLAIRAHRIANAKAVQAKVQAFLDQIEAELVGPQRTCSTIAENSHFPFKIECPRDGNQEGDKASRHSINLTREGEACRAASSARGSERA